MENKLVGVLVQTLEWFSKYISSNVSSTLYFLFHFGQFTLAVSQEARLKNLPSRYSLYCTEVDCKLFQEALAKIATCLYSAKPSSFMTLVEIVRDITAWKKIEFDTVGRYIADS